MTTVALASQPLDSITGPTRSLDEQRAQVRHFILESISGSLQGRWWTSICIAIAWCLRRKRPAPFGVGVLVAALVTLMLSIGTSMFFRETAVMQAARIRDLVIWVGYTALLIIVMQAQVNRAITTLNSTVIESMTSSEDLARLQSLIRKLNNWVWQLLFCLGFGVGVGALSTYVNYTSKGLATPIGPTVLFSLNFFQIGIYVYFFLIYISIFLQISAFRLSIFELDPSSSAQLGDLYQNSRDFTLAVAALNGLLLFLAIILIGFDILTVIAQTIMGWIPSIALFTSAHYSMARIIRQTKIRKLTSIQQLITETEAESDMTKKEPMEAIQRLLDYHERVKSTQNSMLNVRSVSNLIGSLLLPLIATILGNINTILNLFHLTLTP